MILRKLWEIVNADVRDGVCAFLLSLRAFLCVCMCECALWVMCLSLRMYI